VTERSRRLLLDLGLFYAALIWGSTFFVVKGVLDDVHPLTLVSYRFLLSAACMFPFAARKPLRRLAGEGMILGLILMVLYASQTVGLKYTTASNSGFITGLFVLFVPLFLLVFFRTPPGKGQWCAVALAIGGLWILTGGLSHVNRGDVMTLLAAMTYAAHILVTDRYVRRDADPVLLAFHQFWFCGLSCLLLGWLAGASFSVGTAKAAWVIVFLALFPNLSAFFIQILAQKHAPPLKVSLIFSLEPVFAALFAWTVGGEAFSGRKAAGGLLILAAMVLGELSRLMPKKARETEVLPV